MTPPLHRDLSTEPSPEDWRPLLRPLIVREDELPDEIGLIKRDLGGLLVAVLCELSEIAGYPADVDLADEDLADEYDLPEDAPALVDSSAVERYGVDAEELWTIALHNLRQEPRELAKAGGPEDWPVYVLSGSDYAAANLLCLDELAAEPAPHGMLVLLPADDMMWFTPIKDVVSLFSQLWTFQERITAMAELDGTPTDLLSDEVYWWFEGLADRVQLSTLRPEPGEAVQLHVSARFHHLVERLRQESAADQP